MHEDLYSGGLLWLKWVADCIETMLYIYCTGITKTVFEMEASKN